MAIDLRRGRFGYAVLDGPHALIERGSGEIWADGKIRGDLTNNRLGTTLRVSSPATVIVRKSQYRGSLSSPLKDRLLRRLRREAAGYSIPVVMIRQDEIKRVFHLHKNASKYKIASVAVHPQFMESLEIAKDLGLTTIVLSNSWSIRPVAMLPRAAELIDYCEATVLGSNEASHDAITQRPGSYKTLMSNLMALADCGKKIGICTNAMPQNVHEIYDLVSSVQNLSIPIRSLMIQRIIPSGSSSGNTKFGLDLSTVDVLMRQLSRIHSELNIPINFEDPVPWCTVNPAYHHLLARCEWGYTRGAINSADACLDSFCRRCPAPRLSPTHCLALSIPHAARSAIIVGHNSIPALNRRSQRLSERRDP